MFAYIHTYKHVSYPVIKIVNNKITKYKQTKMNSSQRSCVIILFVITGYFMFRYECVMLMSH